MRAIRGARVLSRAFSTRSSVLARPKPPSAAHDDFVSTKRVGEALSRAKHKHHFVRVETSDEPSEFTVPKNILPGSVDAGYRAQDAFIFASHDYFRQTLRGWKIGATNPQVQDALGLESPFYGPVFDSDLYQAPARVRTDHLGMRGLELEFAFELNQDIEPREEAFSLSDVREMVAAVMPALEITGCRFHSDVNVTGPMLIADQVRLGDVLAPLPHIRHVFFDSPSLLAPFFFQGGLAALVIAPQHRMSLKEFEAEEQDHEVALLTNGKVVARGHARSVLGNPLYSLAWLINTFSQEGRPLFEGEIISSGSMIRASFDLFAHCACLVRFSTYCSCSTGDISLALQTGHLWRPDRR